MNLTTAQRQTVAWLVLSLFAALALWLLAPVLTPFVIGTVLAYALYPAVEWLAAHKLPRLAAVLLVEVTFLVALLAIALLIVPVIAKELPLLKAQVPVLFDKLNQMLSPWLAQYGLKINFDVASVKAWLATLLDANMGDWLATALSSARIGGSVLLSVVGNVVLVPVVLLFLLADWPQLVARARSFIPPRMTASAVSFVEECNSVLGQYLRGQLLVMLALAVFYGVALASVGLDLALPVGVFTGLAVAVPYLGFGFGLVLALVAAALQFGNATGVALVVAVYAAGQALESFVLTPRWVGGRIGLSPLAVIFALLAFGQLFGFIGVLIALPASAVVLVALRRARRAYLASPLYQG
jgi:predicted PurR-regulated permease PerM